MCVDHVMNDSIRFRDDGGVEALIPREMYMSIIRLQGAEGLDWNQACVLAGQRIDANTKEFKILVDRSALALYRRKLMVEINKARSTINTEAANRIRQSEDNFRVPCNKNCKKWMYFSSSNSNWPKVKETLYQAFIDWSHTTC